MARYGSDIEFECPNCRGTIQDEIPVPETYWSGDNADERFVEDEAEVACDSCNTGFDLHVQNSDGHISVTVQGYDDVEVKASYASMVEPDEPDDWDLPSEPAIMIQMTLEDVRTVLKSTVPSFHSDTLLRMAFIQQFAALEAYLSDALLLEVLNKPGPLARLIAGDEELKKMKLPLTAIHGNPGIVAHTAATHLRGLLYHNFPKISAIWEEALGFHLFPDDDLKTRMMKAGPIRHDCVHRNGRDKEGNVRTEVDDAFVRQVDTDIRAMVSYIEAQLPLVH